MKKVAEDDQLMLTFDEAVALLGNEKQIHTFSIAGPCLLGCDISKASLIKRLKANKDTIEVAGRNMRAMGHGLAFLDGNQGPLFIEVDGAKLTELEKTKTK